jgi:hypothetical protein
MTAPANASFEAPSAGNQVLGWSLFNPQSGTLALVPEGNGPAEKPAGKQALHFQNSRGLASLRSEPFAVPPSRRVRVQIWLRLSNAQQQPPLQLIVEGNNGYRRAGPLGLGAANIGNDWSEFRYPVEDLPLDGSTQLRFGLDMNGPGEVLIDDVRIFDLYYEERERLHLSNIAFLTAGHLDEKKFGECLRDLDGYWPRFFSAYVPLPQALAPQNQAIAQPGKVEEKSPRAARPLEKWFKKY